MADIAKYAPINGGTLISDLKSRFSIIGTKRTRAVAYGFAVVFMAFTLFLAFAPSSNTSSPWFTNIFTLSTGNGSAPASASIFSDESYRSHSSSLFSYFFPNSTHDGKAENDPSLHKEYSAMGNRTNNGGILNASVLPQKPLLNVPLNNSAPPPPQDSSGSLDVQKNQTQNNQPDDKAGVFKLNLTRTADFQGKDQHLKANQSTSGVTNSERTANMTAKTSPGSDSQVKGAPINEGNQIGKKDPVNNLTSSLMKKPINGIETKVGTGIDELIRSLSKCDMFDGNWVKDDSYPLYNPGSCSLIDEQFNCFLNGRPDDGYYKLKWKPKGCTLPRLSGLHMLEMLRGKRLVFVGDSLNRNMWESLICTLKNSVKDEKKVYEEFGRHHFRTEASYSFVFEDYKCTVEFFVSPFLVEEWEGTDAKGKKKETLRLDLISPSADKYKNADIIVFNTGHWWTHEKTSKGKDYYQEGTHVYGELNVVEAFRKALTYWGRWVDSNINPIKSLVFFRGYSASHFSGGQWNSGGQCDHETEPIKNETYLSPYPQKMAVLEKVLKNMKTPVTYLNVTRMTDYRKDGHPSIYRKLHVSDEERRSPFSFQDCSHWCLPGVPDSWNEILYAQLLVKLNQKP